MALTIKDMLKRPYFQNAHVLAGKSGLNREVKWVHIVEIARFGHLLNGQEVILTTGVGWANDVEKSLSYLHQLLEYDTSALCVELVVHVKELPNEMLAVAETHNFPIIGFKQEVRFIDITKDLHELILGYHEKIWWSLEDSHNQFNEALTSNRSVGDFLKILHQGTNKQVALCQNDEYRFFPSPPLKSRQQWIKNINNNRYYSYPIYLLNNKIAELYLIEEKNQIRQIDELTMKRCSEFLEQYFWKHYQQIEIKQIEQNDWLKKALDGVLSHEQICENLHQHFPDIHLNEAIIGLKPYHQSPMTIDGIKKFETRALMLFRKVLTDFGFHLVTVKDRVRNFYIFLLINQLTKETLYKRLTQAIKEIQTTNQQQYLSNDMKWISFGKDVTNYKQLALSYETALKTLNYQRRIRQITKPFYNHLGVFRLIDQLADQNELKEIIDEYIGRLIDYDETKKTELLKTYEVYLKHLGSKNETARELHIVRQTLYHRLERIEQLIGHDYLDPEKRIMAEIAIYALKVLKI